MEEKQTKNTIWENCFQNWPYNCIHFYIIQKYYVYGKRRKLKCIDL